MPHVLPVHHCHAPGQQLMLVERQTVLTLFRMLMLPVSVVQSVGYSQKMVLEQHYYPVNRQIARSAFLSMISQMNSRSSAETVEGE